MRQHFWIQTFVLLFVTIFLPSQLQAQSRTVVLEQQIGFDTTPPTTPVLQSVTPLSSSQIDVVWSASTDADFGLAGYRLYRDTVQIATTTLLTYSDTGLTPSTTYSYTVEAFDVVNNVSTTSNAISTTTFAIPPVIVATSTVDTSDTGVVWPRLMTLHIDTGVTSAQLTFTTLAPVQFILRYGETTAYDAAVVRSEVLRRDHETFLTDLTPQTEYFYELIGIDRFGRERVLERDSFTTKAAYTIDAPPNVLWFTAQSFEKSVSLQWDNPITDTFSYVRVVRSSYMFPATPTDGFLVYQGKQESFFDTNALATNPTQFYTIFVYNLDGANSSGVIALATVRTAAAETGQDDSGVEIPTEPLDPFDPRLPSEYDNDIDQSMSPVQLYFSDVSIVQGGEVIPASDDTITVMVDESFLVRVPAGAISSSVHRMTLLIQNPFLTRQYTAHLLRLDETETHFEAVVAPLSLAGAYPLRVALYDHNTKAVAVISGTLIVEASPVSGVGEQSFAIYVMYFFLWLLIIFLILRMVWWLLYPRTST